jgi:hypothetical protein
MQTCGWRSRQPPSIVSSLSLSWPYEKEEYDHVGTQSRGINHAWHSYLLRGTS